MYVYRQYIEFFFVVCASVMLGNPTAFAGGQDALWQKAVDIAGRNTWLPGRWVEQEQTFDKKGKLVDQNETHIQLLSKGADSIEWKLLKYVENGKDKTEEVRKEIDGTANVADTLELLELESLFSPSAQDKVSFVRLNKHKTIQGNMCIAYQYRYEDHQAVLEGIAWLDQHTGIPYEVQSELLSVPFVVERVKITEVKQIDRYTYTPQGDWYLVESVEDAKIEMEGLWSKFKGQVHTVSTSSDHWKL